MPAAPPRLDDQVCFALYAATRAIVGAYQPILADMGLTYPQYLVMMVLWEEDGSRVSRLGERLGLDSGTLSPLLKRLEARGLVERRRSARDDRVVEVWLTREGERMKARGAEAQHAAFCKSKMNVGELRRLRDTLKTLTCNLTQGEDEK